MSEELVNTLQTIPECDLGFEEHNPTRTPTIVFLHVALSSPLEASLVIPYLADYHILIPALHTKVKTKTQSSNTPFSIKTINSQIAILIQTKAKNGQAHIYGHSMSSHLAVNLAMSHPDRTLTVIASGMTLTSHFPRWKSAAMGPLLYLQGPLPRAILPRQQQINLFSAFMRPASDDIMAKITARPADGAWSTCMEIGAAMAGSLPPTERVVIRSKTLMIAGTGGPGDTIRDVAWVVDAIRKEGGEAMGIQIKNGVHMWILQLPELCAAVIRAWIEGTDMPEGAEVVK